MVTRELRHVAAVAAMIGLLAFGQAELASAAGLDGVTKVLQNVVDWVIGPFGKVVCVLAIMGVALGWLFGRLEAEKALIVVVAMGVLFAAPDIASLMTGK